MSLYSDLNEVLTPYAQRIKGLTDNVGNLSADLGELQEGGYIADAQQIQTKVNAWLAQHPEATTTVQDGSLTYAKFVTGTLGFVTPEMFGAVGDGVTDDTAAIQTAINSAKKVIFQNKSYRVSIGNEKNSYNCYHALKIPDNTVVDFNGATLTLAPVDGDAKLVYAVVYLTDCQNVTIMNGIIVGDKDNHIGRVFEGQHGVAVFNCKDSKISNMVISKNNGDGICLQANWTTEEILCTSSNVVISNCTIFECRRQGISVIGCNNTTITECYIHDIYGATPHACIDVEGNQNDNDDYPTNTIISNCRLLNNAEGQYIGLIVYPRSSKTLVTGCECSGISLKGSADIIACSTERLRSDIDGNTVRTVSVKDTKINTLQMIGNTIHLDNCDIEILSLTSTGYNEAVLLADFNNCRINNLTNGGQAPHYKLIFNGCQLNKESSFFDGLLTIDEIWLYNCHVNTESRIFGGTGIKKIVASGTTFDVKNAASTALFYANNLLVGEMYNCNIITDQTFTAGKIFGPSTSTPTSIILIGNCCPDRGIVCDGTATSILSKNNYRTELNS